MSRILVWAYAALMALVAAAAVYLWWRGGMWASGEMPTHGMVGTVLGAVVAVAAAFSARHVGRALGRASR